MGRLPHPISKLPFSALWNEIRAYHDEHWKVRFRVAANLIGFWSFPVGWTWEEYPADTEDDRAVYEIRAKGLSHCGLERPAEMTSTGESAVRTGQKHRRKHVERFLVRRIARQEIRFYKGSLVFPQALEESGKTEAEFDVRDLLRVRIRESQLGARLWTRRHCELDAIQLLDHILALTETRGRPPHHDWLKIERWCRDQIEQQGLPVETTRLSNLAAEWYSNQFSTSNEPEKKALDELVTRLKHEYEK